MIMKCKRFLSAILMLMCLTSLFACSNSNSSKDQGKETVNAQSTSGQQKENPLLADDESKQYSYVIMQGKQFDVTPGNPTEKFLEQKFNAKFEFMLVPRGSNEVDYKNKLNLLMASGSDLPDLMQLNDIGIEQRFVEQGLLMPLDELVAKYGQEMIKIRPPETWEVFKFNGKLFSLPNQYNPSSAVPYIRKDWLDKLGMSVPETMEQFEAVIKAFTEKDPDGNGKNDTYGISGPNTPILDSFLNAFLYEGIHFDGWVLRDGKLAHASTLPEAKNALKRINNWYRNGWIDPRFPLMYRDKFEEIIGEGKFGSYFFDLQRIDPAFDIGLKTLYDRDPKAYFTTSPPIKDKKGEQHLYTGDFRSLGYTMAISAKCKNPARLMKMINYAASEEGYMRIRYGVKGVNYTIDDKGTVKYIPPWDDINKRTQEGLSIQYSNLFRREWEDKAASPEVWKGKDIVKKYGSSRSPIFTTTPAMIKSNTILNQLRDDTFTKIIVNKGDMDIDKAFDDFVAKWKADGGNDITREINDEYGKSAKK